MKQVQDKKWESPVGLMYSLMSLMLNDPLLEENRVECKAFKCKAYVKNSYKE